MKPIKKSAKEVFDIYAEAYDEWIKTIYTYDATLEVFCSLIKKPNAAIIDLACGPGNIIKYILNKQPDYKITGVDLSPKMITIAKNNFPVSDFKLMDFKLVKSLNAQYDGIICGFGLPYISKIDAIEFIKNAIQCLKPDGILYISTMENEKYTSKVEPSSSGEYETQMYYHEGRYLKQNMLDCGLTIMLEERIKSVNKKGENVVDLILIGQLKNDI